MTDFRFHSIAPSRAPGLPESVRGSLASGAGFETAAEGLVDLDSAELPAGSAWADDSFRASLLSEHERLGASDASLRNIKALGKGAACVITGQQPGLLLGPGYTLWKAVGAISLATSLRHRHGRPVVPVFWMGSDDSDFDEVRRSWLWQRGRGIFRSQLNTQLHRPGLCLGAVADPAIGRAEQAALESTGVLPARMKSWLEELSEFDGLADRAAAWLLRLFAKQGLVIVDARNLRLRSLGSSIFSDYAQRHAEIAEALAARPGTLDTAAVESALFHERDGVRRKLGPDELDGALPPAEELSPSVVLRPVWQDALLAPVAAVLGPGELQYHAQIAPAYQAMGVRAARPVLRPHITLVPDTWPCFDSEDDLATLLAGGAAAHRVLAAGWRPKVWRDALANFENGHAEAWSRLAEVIDDESIEAGIQRLQGHSARRSEHLARLVDRASLRRGSFDAEWVGWVAPRSKPQDRFFSSLALAATMGDGLVSLLDAIESHYEACIDSGGSPTWAVAGKVLL